MYGLSELNVINEYEVVRRIELRRPSYPTEVDRVGKHRKVLLTKYVGRRQVYTCENCGSKATTKEALAKQRCSRRSQPVGWAAPKH